MTYDSTTGTYTPGTPFDFSDVRSGLLNMPNFNVKMDLSHIHVAMRTAEYLGVPLTEISVEEALRFFAPATAGIVTGVPT